jgi:hypothetical protein
MNTLKRHKYLSILLGVIFSVFTIGIPIVITTCPMMNSGHQTASCCLSLQRHEFGGTRFEGSKSCCRQTVTFNRNTNEFLQTLSPGQHFVRFSCYTSVPVYMLDVPVVNATNQSIVSSTHFLYKRSQRTGDLPILLSSLLI